MLSTLTIDSVSKQFNQSTIIDGFTQLGANFTSKVDTIYKTFDIYNESGKIFSFTYGDDYIEYDNRSAVITEENLKYMNNNDILTIFWIQGIMESILILILSSYENKILSENYTNEYEKYGVQLETESYNFSSKDEDESSYSISVETIKYFKISLDTDKIDALVAKNGINTEKQDSDKEVINSLTPILEVKNINENPVTLYPSINYYNTAPDYSVNCYVYWSNDENGIYEKISDFAVNCLGEVGIIDKNLKSNTTYYYKTIVDGGTIYSASLKVTTTNKNTTAITDNIV